MDSTYLRMKVGVLTKSDLTIEVLPCMVTVGAVIRLVSRPLQTELGMMTKSHTVEKRLTPRWCCPCPSPT